jgi:hypothetical protein
LLLKLQQLLLLDVLMLGMDALLKLLLLLLNYMLLLLWCLEGMWLVEWVPCFVAM